MKRIVSLAAGDLRRLGTMPIEEMSESDKYKFKMLGYAADAFNSGDTATASRIVGQLYGIASMVNEQPTAPIVGRQFINSELAVPSAKGPEIFNGRSAFEGDTRQVPTGRIITKLDGTRVFVPEPEFGSYYGYQSQKGQKTETIGQKTSIPVKKGGLSIGDAYLDISDGTWKFVQGIKGFNVTLEDGAGNRTNISRKTLEKSTSLKRYAPDTLDSITAEQMMDAGGHVPETPTAINNKKDVLKKLNKMTKNDIASQFGDKIANFNSADDIAQAVANIIEDTKEKSKNMPFLTVTKDKANNEDAPIDRVQYRTSENKWQETPVEYGVVDVNSVIPSHTEAGWVNLSYPAEMQPRDRTRINSLGNIEEMARDLRPEMLGEDMSSDRGAPIISKDGVVVSGNGRILSAMKAYKKYSNTSGKKYHDWLLKYAKEKGLDLNKINGIKNPVLVRRLLDDNLDLKAFAEDANSPVIAGMSAMEQARVDAEKLTPEILSKFNANDSGDLLLGNGDFLEAFRDGVVRKAEMDRFIDKNGKISQDAIRRITNALVFKAYGDSSVLERLSESTDDNMRNITKALTQAAPSISIMENMMENGYLNPKLSIRNAVTETIQTIEYIKNNGFNLAEILNQQNIFGGSISPEAKTLLRFFEGNKRKVKNMYRLLSDYAQASTEIGSPQQSTIFSEKLPTVNDILLRSIKKQGQDIDGNAAYLSAANQGRFDFYGDEDKTQSSEKQQQAEHAETDEAKTDNPSDNSPVVPVTEAPQSQEHTGASVVSDKPVVVESGAQEPQERAKEDGELSSMEQEDEVEEQPVEKPKNDATNKGIEAGSAGQETKGLANNDVTASETSEGSEPSSQKADMSKPAGEKIEDFGEKIGGAKKDAARYRRMLENVYSDEDIANKSLSEIFPIPNYKKEIDSGGDIKAISLVRAIREAIPAKPRSSGRLRGYVNTVKAIREVALKIFSDPDYGSQHQEDILKEFSIPMRRVFEKAALYEAMGHDIPL
ncbi:MAG: hypothetical protein RR214_00225, partial [Synergistaceae bacterium]